MPWQRATSGHDSDRRQHHSATAEHDPFFGVADDAPFHIFHSSRKHVQVLAVVTPTMVPKLPCRAPLLAILLLLLFVLVPTALAQCPGRVESCNAGDGGCSNTCNCACVGTCYCYPSGDPYQCKLFYSDVAIGVTYGGDCTTTCNPCYLNCGCGLSTSCTPVCSICYCSCDSDGAGNVRCPTSGRRLSSYVETAATPSIEPLEEDRQLKGSLAPRKGNSKTQAKKSQRAYKRQCLAYVKSLDRLCDANCTQGIPPNGVNGPVSASICSALCAAQTAVRQVSCSR